MSFTFAQIFFAALIFFVAVHTFTCLAELIHLKRNIDSVPEEFRSVLSPALHKKNIQYDMARTRLNTIEAWVTSGVILALTAGGIINDISDFLLDSIGDGFAFHWMLPAIVAFILVVSDLPFYWYKSFRLSEAYGYQRQSRFCWFKNYFLNTVVGFIAVLPIFWVLLFLWRHTGTAWWIFGWLIFGVYAVFSLNLSKRLSYWLFKPKSALAISHETEQSVKALCQKANIQVEQMIVCKADDNAHLPPAFAFGTQEKLHLFIRHDAYQSCTQAQLNYLISHAVARNRSHMYLQSWVVTSLIGLGIFLFLKWLAPQSWFMDELGFRVYGPGPYYGSLTSFALVALPVFIFPFKVLLDAFLRHLVFKSDRFGIDLTDSQAMQEALLKLLPVPMRHSVCTLGIFDLLFSHEPSVLLRMRKARAFEQERKQNPLKQTTQAQKDS